MRTLEIWCWVGASILLVLASILYVRRNLRDDEDPMGVAAMFDTLWGTGAMLAATALKMRFSLSLAWWIGIVLMGGLLVVRAFSLLVLCPIWVAPRDVKNADNEIRGDRDEDKMEK